MKFTFHNKKITGLLTVIPKNVKTFDEEMKNYKADTARTKRLKTVMGYEEHRVFDENICVSDIAVYGMEYLFEQGLLKKDEFDAMILVTQSPDYFSPPTSNVIQGRLDLPHHIYCMDINQGCAGYITGLMEAFSWLEQEDVRKIVLINADVLSHKVSKADRNSYPLSGDAASISIIEKCDYDNVIQGEIKMDGTGYDVIMIPAGGFRMPSTPETAVLREDSEGNLRSLDNLVMKGREVFYFVQTTVPNFIDELLNRLNITKDEIDWWLFHQPNKFMVDKLAEAMEIPYEKMPSNIVTHFGNSGGVTIPMNMAYNLGDKLEQNSYKVCLAGFGVGLTWGAMVMDMGDFDFCRMIEF